MSYNTNEYVIYLRKSRADVEAEGRGEGETLARHEKMLIELARRQKLTITEIYREVVSGETIAARPIMQKLLSEVESSRWTGVLVVEVERLARGDTMDQGFVAQAFKFSDTKIITPMKTYDPNNEFDEEYFEFGLFMSRREYKTINRRLQRGRVASVREGKYVSNKSPYGYQRVKISGDKGYTLEIIPEQAEIVRMIFNLYTVGEVKEDGTLERIGVNMIMHRLNDLKVPSRSGGQWYHATIRDMLINPVYIGKIRWNWRPEVKKIIDGQVIKERPRSKDFVLVDGLHEAIIEEDIFYLAQDYMTKNPPRPIGERYLVKNPLGGLVVCGVCGRKMVRRPYPNPDQPDSLMCHLTGCPNVSSQLHLVEERILSSLAEWLRDYKLQWEQGVAPQTDVLLDAKRKALDKIESELQTLEKQRSSIHDFLEQGIYDTETFLDRTRELSERVKLAEADRRAIESDLNLEEVRAESRQTIIPKVENLLEVYHQLPSPKAKNDLLKEVLEKVVYKKERGAKWKGVSMDDFELELYPRVPKQRVFD